MKNLEIKDFSGGETDNYFQGEPTRAQLLLNLLVGIDHKLSSRQGSLATGNTRKSARINSIASFNSLTDLVYSSQSHFYDSVGAEILGPSGNPAFNGASADTMYTFAELQGHLIIAADDVLAPQKIYKDDLGVLQVRNVGLPQVKSTPISDAALLAQLIISANNLRTIFLNHINSAQNLDSERPSGDPLTGVPPLASTLQPVTSTNAHWSVDKYALSYFQAVTFSPGQWQPNTIPTPAPAATDYATLVALITALNFAFEEHREDSAGFAAITSAANGFTYGPNRYHALGYQTQFTDGTWNFGFPNSGANIGAGVIPFSQGIQQRTVESPDPNSAVNASTPQTEVYRTQLVQIANFLDDLAVKFLLHEVAPMVHRYNYQNAQGNAFVDAAFSYQFLAPILTGDPVVIPTPFNFIYAANFVQRAFNNHALNTDILGLVNPTFPTMHSLKNESIVSGLFPAGFYFATLPATPTVREQYTAFLMDTILAKVNLFTARYSYFIHTMDLFQGEQDARINQISSSGGPGTYQAHYQTNPASVDYTTGQPQMVVIGPYANNASNGTPKKETFEGIISYSGSGVYHVNYDTNALVFSNYTVGTFVMHPYPLMSGNTSFPSYETTPQYLGSFGFAPDIYDLAGWVSLIETFYTSFKSHMETANSHYFTSLAVFEFDPTSAVTGAPAGSVQYYPLSSLLPDVDLPDAQPLFIIPEIKSFSYAFTYSDTYTTDGGVEFLVESAPIFSAAFQSEETLAVGVVEPVFGETGGGWVNQIITPVAMILNVPDLTNDGTTNYATTLLNYYRTTGNTDSYFKINILPATPLYLPVVPITIDLLGGYDLVSDVYSINGNVALNNSQDILYTNGGISPSYQPPKSKYTWLANGYVYYGGVYDGNTFLPNRVLQSEQLAPDWVPAQNSIDFESPVTGGGYARNVNVAMTETGIYRLEGAFGTDGSGAIVKQQISNQIGGISASSIVVTELGLFFAGTNGFYYTDGYQCIRVSQELFKTYKNATSTAAQKRAIRGMYDRANRRVLWTMRSDSTKTDCDIIFTYDINFGITPSGTFTRLKGGNGSWNPSTIGFLENVLYIGDEDGYLYHLDSTTKTDPLKDNAVAQASWGTTYIPWEWRSTIMDFGGTAMRKFFSRIHHVGKNLGDVAIQYYIIADNKVMQNLAPMRFIDDGSSEVVDQWRRVGGQKLRADVYQIGAKNGDFTVYNSDTYGGTPQFVSNVATVTTMNVLATHLPLDSVGMNFCFATDRYVTQFLIKSVAIVGADTVLTLADPLNKVNGLISLEWEMRGFMKDQAFSLDAFTIWYEEQGNLGSQYRGYSSDQGGGGNK